MKTRFIMIRHGFSVANDQKRFAGHLDFALTELGRLQAERCAEALKNEKIDAIYSSDLSRAYDTARPIAKLLGLEIIKSERLREIYAGKWEGRSFDELCEIFAEDYSVWKNDIGRARCTGGESVGELSDRILGELKRIAYENPEKTVCITTHATPIRAVCTKAVGLETEDMVKISWTANASISIFEYEDGIFTAIDTSNTDHLGELCTKLSTNV